MCREVDFSENRTFGVTREMVESDYFGTLNRQINCRTPSGPCPGSMLFSFLSVNMSVQESGR